MSELATKLDHLSPEQRELFLLRLKKIKLETEDPAVDQIEARPRQGDTFPVSFAQERFWFLDQLVPGNPADHIPGALRLRGDLDADLLAKSFTALVARHEALRTRFASRDGEPEQVIEPPFELTLPLIDLQDRPADEREREVEQLILENHRQPFDLSELPLMRLALLRLTPTEHVLLVTLHHIIADGWSLGVLVHEIMKLYEAFHAGRTSPLPELPIQYLDYAEWQREQMESGALQGDMDFWMQQLSGDLQPLELPIDHPRPTFQSYEGDRLPFTVDPRLTAAVYELGRSSGSTLFMTLLGVYQAMLYRYSGQTDFLVGSPIANRNRPEIEGLIGFFINMLVLRADFSGDDFRGPTFKQLLRRAQDVALDAYSHQDLPFEKLVEELQPERDPSRSPLFQVLLVVQNAPLPSVSVPGLELSSIETHYGTSQYDLSLSIFEKETFLEGWFEYNTTLFDPSTIQRFTAHFLGFLDAIANNPDGHVHELLAASDPARHCLFEWNDTGVDPVATTPVHRLFEQVASQHPEALAVLFEDHSLNYAELNRRANRLARHLQAQGVSTECAVGVYLERCLDLPVALLAILKAGGVYLPLDIEYPIDRVLYTLEDSGAVALISRREEVADWDLEAFEASGRKLVLLDRDTGAIDGQDGADLEPMIEPGHLAYAIYTSGSTGRPKGVMVEHAPLANHMAWRQRHFRMQPGERILHKTSIGFDTSLWEFLEPFLAGATMVIARPGGQRESDYLVEKIRQDGVTGLDFVPSMLPFFLEEEGLDQCTSLRRINTGGELLSPELHRRLCERLDVDLFNGYGPTETCIAVTFWSRRRGEIAAEVPIGRAVDNTGLYVVDRADRPVPVGVAGELLISGASLARGYIGRPATTAAAFVPDEFSGAFGARCYRTGDLVAYRADGNLEFRGRIDDQIKIRGFRVELGEIEEGLRQHPAIRQTVVLALGDDPRSRHLAAYLVLEPDVSEDELPISQLRAFLGETLPEYMVPSAWMVLPALPLTASGKVDRAALPNPGRGRRAISGEYAPPRNPLEEVLTDLWIEVLGQEQIGIHDSFFELGGHSLLAIQLIAKIREAFSVDLPLRELFNNNTVAKLAGIVTHLQGKTKDGETLAKVLPQVDPDPDHRYEPFPLTEVQQAYWIGRHQALELGGVAAHSYSELDGRDWDLDRLNLALRKLIDRHEMLRAIILPDGTQRILEHIPPYEVQTYDLREADEETIEEHLAERREEMSHQMLATDRFPLFDLRATLLAEGRLRLHMSVDGLLYDAWSSRILEFELPLLYLEPDIELRTLGLSFRDYVQTMEKMQDTPIYQSSLDYWQERVKTLPPAPQLPESRHGAGEDTGFSRWRERLEPEIWGKVKEYGTRRGVTPSAVVLTAFSEILATWSKSSDFTINMTLFNRQPIHPYVDRIVGDFTSLTMHEINDALSGSFEDRARRVQERLWEDLDHSYVSGVRVLRELARDRGEVPRALMPVVFTSTLNLTRQAQSREVEEEVDEGQLVYGVSQTPQVSLDHQVFEQSDTLFVTWDAVEAMFPEGLLELMFGTYRDLLHRLGDEDDSAWSETARCLTPPVELTARGEINATEQDISSDLLHQLFHRQAALQPDEPAVLAPGVTLTYRQLQRRVIDCAQRLRQAGAVPNQLVAVVMEKGWEQVVATLAILEAGAAYLPIDPELPAERRAYLLDNGEAEIIVTQPWLEERLDWPATGHRLVIENETPDADLEPLDAVQKPEDLAYVIYTSGTTGNPKGVVIDHRGAVNTILDVNQRFEVGPQDRVFGLSSLSFDLSVYDVFGTLAAGGALVLPAADARRDPSQWAELVSQHGVTLWNSVPALMEMFVEWLESHPENPPEALRLVLMSGDWIPLGLPQRIRDLAPAQLISLGGATEASIWSILYPIEEVDADWTSIPYGKPMVNQTFHVLDAATLAPRPVWVPGELYIGGIGLAKGYWKDAEKTAGSFVVHPQTGERLYRTGDLGRYLPDGNIEFLGREDLQVKVQGHRIELGEIEAALGEHPEIAATVVCAVGEPHGNKRLVAYFVTGEDASEPPSNQHLQEFLENKLPHYMVPGSFVRLETLPLTANGKVNRKVLAQQASELPAPAPATPESAPQPVDDTLAAEVRKLVAQVLAVDEVDTRISLLDMGATSVEIVRISNLLESELGFRPKMNDMFRLSIDEAVTTFYRERIRQAEIYDSGTSDSEADDT
ncbi:MAG: amino acid adenylation domain-containing protein, partial [Acidobacteriota bacterium]